MSISTAIIPSRHVAPLWEAFQGLVAYGHPMRAGVVIELWDHFDEFDKNDKPVHKVVNCRATSGMPLVIAG